MPIDPQRMAAILQQVQRTGGAPMPSSPPPAMPPQGMPPRPMMPPGGMRR
jgi:hypothetical protein